MKVGYIGLGNLGRAMAERLLSQGVELVVWNRTIEKARGLDAEVAESPIDVLAKAPIVFLNVFDSTAVQEILEGKNGLLMGDCTDKIIVDTTTNHFDSVRYFHYMVKESGGSYLEAPVIGTVSPALQGKLTVLVSGDKSVFEKVRKYLDMIGSTIFFLEQPSLATKMKLINNVVLGVLMASIGEAVSLGETAGLPRDKVLEILAAGAGNSVVLNGKREKLSKKDFSTQFSAALMYKDLHFVQDLAKSLHRPLFTASVAKELFGMTYPKHMEEKDFSVVYEIFNSL